MSDAPLDTTEATEAAEPATPPTEDEVRAVLQTVEDPELRMSIVDLGLLYDVRVEDDGLVAVDMTLTSPACPVGPMLQGMIYHKVAQLPGVLDVEVLSLIHI